MVAADHADSVSKIIIVDTPAELPPHMLTQLTQQSATAEVPPPETFATFEEVITHGMAQYPLTPEAELRHANYHNLYRGMDGTWRWRWDPMLLVARRQNRRLQGDLYAALRRVTCPALLIRGASSPLLTPEVARKMLEALPNGRMVEIPGAAHTVNADNATEFERVTTAFLRQ
jgi:pimeloyl-ACP methyl ester carboxylesterase